MSLTAPSAAPVVTPKKRLEVLFEELSELAGQSNAIDGRIVEIVAEIDRDGLCGITGARSVAGLVAWKLGLSSVNGKTIAAVAGRLQEFPRCAAAMREGRLSLDQVGVIAAGAGAGSDEHYAQLASVATVNQLRTAVKLEPRPQPDPRPEPQASITQTCDEEFSCWRIKLPHPEAAKFDAALASHRDALIAVLKNAKGLVLVDEAYHEFSGQTAFPLLSDYRNLVVLRTFSKAMAMAGLRFGYMMAHPEIVREINKSKLPYNVNIFTLAAAEAVIEKRSVLDRGIATLIQERDRVFTELQKRPSLRAYPSKANFILMKTAKPARNLFDALYQQGVLVRDVSSYPLLDRCLRVSIGTPEENNRFLKALDQALENKS